MTHETGEIRHQLYTDLGDRLLANLGPLGLLALAVALLVLASVAITRTRR